MIENWDLVVIDDRDLTGWTQPAEQFTDFLKVLSAAVAESYGTGLLWHGLDMPQGDWIDPSQIERLFVKHRPRDERRQVLNYVPSGVVVQGFLDRGADTRFDHENWFVNLRGTASGEAAEPGLGGLSVNAEFYAARSARSLLDHDLDWLIRLLASTGASVSATYGRITTDGLLDAIVDADKRITVGGLTLAPHGVELDPWPSSLTAYPCPVGYSDGQVVVADLDLLVNDPSSVIPDLLSLNAALPSHDSN